MLGLAGVAYIVFKVLQPVGESIKAQQHFDNPSYSSNAEPKIEGGYVFVSALENGMYEVDAPGISRTITTRQGVDDYSHDKRYTVIERPLIA